MSQPCVRLLQVTDLHLLGNPDDRLLGVDTADSFRAVLAQAFAEHSPDAVLATGDITHHGDAEAYQRFVDILSEFHSGAWLALPGNHDQTAAMQQVLGDADELRLDGWSVVGFDSHVDNQPGAAVSAEELERVRVACRAETALHRHVLLATHHPPVLIDCPWLDKDHIQNAGELLDYLCEHTTVAAMVFGHAHQRIDTSHGKLALLGTPSTCFQFAPRSEKFTIDTAKPGYRWLQLEADGTLASQVGRVQDYPLRIDLSRKH